jgi:hypothetical protein
VIYRLVEKANRHATHGIFDTRESADRFLRDIVPTYVARGFYSDKTLTADSFEIVSGGGE